MRFAAKEGQLLGKFRHLAIARGKVDKRLIAVGRGRRERTLGDVDRKNRRKVRHQNGCEGLVVPDLRAALRPQAVTEPARLGPRYLLSRIDEKFRGQPARQRDVEQRVELLRRYGNVDLKLGRLL